MSPLPVTDRRINFVGASKELGMNTDNITVGNYLQEKGCPWFSNPPHSSHMGVAIMDAMLPQTWPVRLTHEVLSTLMAEVVAIINARPLVSVYTDPDMHEVLTPTTFLTKWVLFQHPLETLQQLRFLESNGNKSSVIHLYSYFCIVTVLQKSRVIFTANKNIKLKALSCFASPKRFYVNLYWSLIK